MTTTTEYLCWFMWGYVRKYVTADQFDRFTEGFWLNEDMEYTWGSDARYWIPPGRILFIEKVTK